jgi:hypothetical protein
MRRTGPACLSILRIGTQASPSMAMCRIGGRNRLAVSFGVFAEVAGVTASARAAVAA